MKKLQNLSLSGGLSNSTDFGLCSHTKQNAFTFVLCTQLGFVFV